MCGFIVFLLTFVTQIVLVHWRKQEFDKFLEQLTNPC